MTKQVEDRFLYNGQECDIILCSGNRLDFNPKDHGIETKWRRTSCYRGYIATHEIKDNRLLFTDVIINIKGVPKPICGVEPDNFALDGKYYDGIELEYKNIDFPIKFTGLLILGLNKLPCYKDCVNWGFRCHQIYEFETVYELTLKEGVVTNVKDLSLEAAEMRKRELPKSAIMYDADMLMPLRSGSWFLYGGDGIEKIPSYSPIFDLFGKELKFPDEDARLFIPKNVVLSCFKIQLIYWFYLEFNNNIGDDRQKFISRVLQSTGINLRDYYVEAMYVNSLEEIVHRREKIAKFFKTNASEIPLNHDIITKLEVMRELSEVPYTYEDCIATGPTWVEKELEKELDYTRGLFGLSKRGQSEE